MLKDTRGDICCCPVCGRMISYLEYHRNDLIGKYEGYCYICEDNKREENGDKE